MLSVPMSLAGLLISTQVVVGLASRKMTDVEREANARFSAWLLIVIVAWVGVCGVALYGPLLLSDAAGQTWRLKGFITLSGVAGLLTAVLGASSRTAVPGASSAEVGRTGFVGKLQRAAVGLAAPVFVVTVIVLVSRANASILSAACGKLPRLCPQDGEGGLSDLLEGRSATLSAADFASPLLVVAVIAALLLVGYLLGRRIDTNRFSLHAMYRMRLIRTFLGASKPPGERQPNPFTGFDDTDDMPIGDLWPARRATHDPGAAVDAPHPPLHVVNLTLNTVAGTDLATQSRKATSFTVSALHAGSVGVGYRRTSGPDDAEGRLYGGRGGITLGTAMAISGAAASPNAGYHSSPAVTFLMTLFNARLGWWLGNPGPAGRRSFSDEKPRLALVPILQEMFGRTTDHSPYVYLSDGGHFENLGLYEMVRRRCRFIVISDAGCDPNGDFTDLGGAIRKIRIDFGIPIDFEGGIPIHSRGAGIPPEDATYWAVGRIRYSVVDGLDTHSRTDGLILYIKPAFYGKHGKEPRDVYNYGMSTPAFPHESTGDQFFGETQFESYRALGAYTVDKLCDAEFSVTADSGTMLTRAQIEGWFRARGAAAPSSLSLTTSPV